METPEGTRPPLGQVLLSRGLVNEDQLLRALRLQEENGGRLGEVLVELGAISVTALADALLLQHAWRPLGRMLVERGLLTEEQLDDALAVQEKTGRPLAEIVRTKYLLSASEIGEIVAEQHELELEMDRGFGSGLRNGIDRRQHRSRDDADAGWDETGRVPRPATNHGQRDRLIALKAALEDAEETITALGMTNRKRGAEIVALQEQVAERDALIHELRRRLGGRAPVEQPNAPR